MKKLSIILRIISIKKKKDDKSIRLIKRFTKDKYYKYWKTKTKMGINRISFFYLILKNGWLGRQYNSLKYIQIYMIIFVLMID